MLHAKIIDLSKEKIKNEDAEDFIASSKFGASILFYGTVRENSSIKDLRNKIIKYVDEKFKGNENFKKIIETSAFCSEDNNIISDNYQITKDQKIGIIPPIGGG